MPHTHWSISVPIFYGIIKIHALTLTKKKKHHLFWANAAPKRSSNFKFFIYTALIVTVFYHILSETTRVVKILVFLCVEFFPADFFRPCLTRGQGYECETIYRYVASRIFLLMLVLTFPNNILQSGLFLGLSGGGFLGIFVVFGLPRQVSPNFIPHLKLPLCLFGWN